MANSINDIQMGKVREAYQRLGSIRQVAKELDLSRNTIRRLIRTEGLSVTQPSALLPDQSKSDGRQASLSPHLEKLDFLMLEKMFARSGEPSAAKDFELHIKSLAQSIATEIGVNGRIDLVRIEGAVASYISWRRFYFMSLEASDKEYCGPFKKYHDKAAIAVDRWVSASNKAFDQMNRLLRELEVKYGQRKPDFGRNNVFVQNQQINIPPASDA